MLFINYTSGIYIPSLINQTQRFYYGVQRERFVKILFIRILKFSPNCL